MNLPPEEPTTMTYGIQFFDDRHHDDYAMSRIPSPSAISKFEQSSAAFMATNLLLDKHEVHHHSMSPSHRDDYPYQGTRKGWNDMEQVKKDATIQFMEYPSNHTILCKTRPSMRVNVSHNCSGEHLTPRAANPPWKDKTTTMNNEKLEQVKRSTTQAQWIQASTRLYDPAKGAVDGTNYRSRRKTRIETYLDSFRVHSIFRRVHPASPRSSSTHIVNESNTHPEAPVPPDEPTTLANIARSTHSLFHSNHGLGQRSTSSDLAIENTTNGGVIGTLFPRHSIYAEVDYYNLKDMGADTCIVPSLLNAFEVEVSGPMESDEDGSTVVSFVPKMATPVRLSRADVFGEDPPTPSSSSYHDADSQPLSACDFSRSQAESDILGSWSNFVTEKSVTDFSYDLPRVIQLNTPHNDVEEFFTPSSPSTSSSTRAQKRLISLLQHR
ncbi:hypothetical protein MHU86_5113 [Fragilaria crotonensis]|nr:hypothetical protein MHU86_5113 [Fragilaria crotonensis]